MPHQCVRCRKFYEAHSEALLNGCNCGGKLFFFVKQSAMEKAKEFQEKLSENDRVRIEKDIKDIIEETSTNDKPVILDFEAIQVLKPGQYEIDIANLFKKNPLIVKTGEGKYFIDLAGTFNIDKDNKEDHY